MYIRNLSIFVSALALSACAAGPDYVAPRPTAAASFVTKSDPQIVSAAPAAQDWWRLYRDPVLDRLIADALAANTDIRVSVARLERARAALGAVKADRLPATTLAAGVQRQRLAASQVLPGSDRQNSVVDAGLSVAYEVDLFGRVKRNVEAARGDVGAAQADLDAVRVSIVSETTRAYVDAASAAQRLAVAQRVVALLDRSLRVTSRRQAAGLTTPLETARMTALREQRRAEIPQITAQRQAALFRLATLTGRAPGDLPAEAGAILAPPRLDRPIPVGDGRELLARRPDVVAAERRLAASTARIGVTTAELYPNIVLGASAGSTGFGGDDVFGSGPFRWSVGPLVSWSFPNLQAARSRVAGARADSRAALALFDASVLQALEETETALSNYAMALDRRAALQVARDQGERAVRIVRADQREGRADSLSLLDAERTFADAESQLAMADAQIADAQVDLFKALGGGWRSARS
jgi:NodT family efflux transporter outer membrane factor (OMF) lipoprotein